MENRGGINQYVCDKCGYTITTVNADDGVTPFMMRCHNSATCKGMMHSRGYNVPKNLLPDYEWYKPRSIMRLTKWEQAHCKQGGLLLRKWDAGEVKL